MAPHKGRGILFGGVFDQEESEEDLSSIFYNDLYIQAQTPLVNDVDMPTKSVATAILNSNFAPHAPQNENPLNPLVPPAPTAQKTN